MRRILFFIFITVFTVNSWSFIHINYLDEGFNDTGKDLANVTVISSAYFIRASSTTFKLLYEVEKADNLTSANSLYIPDIKADIIKAIECNNKAIEIAKNVGYIEEKKVILREFDYNKLIEENGMISKIVANLIPYFKECDLIGIYKENDLRLKGILDIIKKIEYQKSPQIDMYWDLNKNISETTLFGNYVSIIAKNVLR